MSLNFFTNGGFVLNNISDLPVSSIFLQFIARFMLAIEHSDEKWFGSLSGSGVSLLNNYILNRFNQEDTCVFNLRPLPRPTERLWPYENIGQKDYIKNYNFLLKKPSSDSFKEIRINSLKNGFKQIDGSLVIGIGDKENKRAFFETLFGYKFELTSSVISTKNIKSSSQTISTTNMA
jgi:hypothetical protein